MAELYEGRHTVVDCQCKHHEPGDHRPMLPMERKPGDPISDGMFCRKCLADVQEKSEAMPGQTTYDIGVTYIAVTDAPARLDSTRHSVEFFADVDGRRVTNRMAQEEVEFIEQEVREAQRPEPEVMLAIFERNKAEMHRIAAWKIGIGERNETGGANVFLRDRDRFAQHR